jgi:hypothetical protein
MIYRHSCNRTRKLILIAKLNSVHYFFSHPLFSSNEPIRITSILEKLNEILEYEGVLKTTAVLFGVIILD